MFDMSKSKSLDESQGVAPLPVETGEIGDSIDIQHDAVFGDITEDGPNYRNVGLSWPLEILLMCQRLPGGMAGNRYPDDQNPDRSRRPIYSFGF